MSKFSHDARRRQGYDNTSTFSSKTAERAANENRMKTDWEMLIKEKENTYKQLYNLKKGSYKVIGTKL